MDANVRKWATAISTHASSGRKIIWRFAQEFQPDFAPESLPARVIIIWRYESETGLPDSNDHGRMNVLEDLLAPITDNGRFATLALVSTGEGLREWTYYSKSADLFIDRLNEALAQKTAFPIEIGTADDPTWSMYRDFKAHVRDKPAQTDDSE